MQLSLSFSALLAGVLVALSVPEVQAAPFARAPKMVTLPLKRMEVRSDVHPQIVSFVSSSSLPWIPSILHMFAHPIL